jgi:hypothetical protein
MIVLVTAGELFPAVSRAVTVRVDVWRFVTAVVHEKTWLALVDVSGLQPVVDPVRAWE